MNETTAALEDSGDKIDQPRPPISKRPLRQLNSKERHKVFISYRDTDSAGITGRIYADLTKRFGKKTVFRAPDSIEPSAKWPASIIRTLSETAVMLVVIGPRWLDSKDKDGKRRLDNPEDWVRREIEAAFKDHMAVIPVLLDATSVPDREALPESLQPLVDIMTVPVRDGRHFSRDMRDLIQLITLKISAISRRRLIVLGGLTAAAAAISGGVIWLWIKRSQPPPSPSSHLMVWSYTIPASPKFQGDADTGVIARPAEADGIAYILSTNGTIYALDARTGDLIWHSIDLKLTGAPAVTRGVVCAPSSEGTICGFDSSKGTLLWTTSAAHKFSLSAGASVTAIDGFVYAGSDDGNIYAFDATMEGGGALQWQALTPGRASLSSPTVADGQSGPLLLVASDDGIAYSFDAIHGGGPL